MDQHWRAHATGHHCLLLEGQGEIVRDEDGAWSLLGLANLGDHYSAQELKEWACCGEVEKAKWTPPTAVFQYVCGHDPQ